MPLSRRHFIRAGGLSSLLATAGCVSLGQDDGDLVIQNDDVQIHSVTAIMDQGSSYTPRLESAHVDPESTERISDFFPRSDWNYPFFLHVYVDGEYVETTNHQWQDEIEIRITSETEIEATETEHPVDITPTVRNQTRT